MALGVVRAPLSPGAAFCSVKVNTRVLGGLLVLLDSASLAEVLLGWERGFQCRATGDGPLVRGLEFFWGGWNHPTPSPRAEAAAILMPLRSPTRRFSLSCSPNGTVGTFQNWKEDQVRRCPFLAHQRTQENALKH